jgi:hypothetical protein
MLSQSFALAMTCPLLSFQRGLQIRSAREDEAKHELQALRPAMGQEPASAQPLCRFGHLLENSDLRPSIIQRTA